MTRARLRLALLVAAVATGGLVATLTLGDDLEVVRATVAGAGAWGALLFLGLHVALGLVPVPRSLLALVAGAVFGAVAGTALSYAASLLAAAAGYAVARRLGREAVTELTGPRVERVERALRHQGLAAVVVARLTPVAPFVVTNYAAGISAVRTRDYVVGSVVGLLPGSVAWAAVGSSAGRDPRTLVVALSVAVVLLLAAVVVGRRLRGTHHPSATTTPRRLRGAHHPPSTTTPHPDEIPTPD